MQSERVVEGNGVLIIDDSRFMLLRMKHTVESLGYAVVGVAENGTFGADMAVTLNPHLIFLDYSMPDMNGLQCLRLIRERRPDAVVVMLSGTLTLDASKALLAAGARDLLTKPVQLNALIGILTRHLGKGQLVGGVSRFQSAGLPGSPGPPLGL